MAVNDAGGNSSTGAKDSPATSDFKKKMKSLSSALSDYDSGETAATVEKAKGLSAGRK